LQIYCQPWETLNTDLGSLI